MELKELKPKKALNKAFLKVKSNRFQEKSYPITRQNKRHRIGRVS